VLSRDFPEALISPRSRAMLADILIVHIWEAFNIGKKQDFA
jgi:hypothetical protein